MEIRLIESESDFAESLKRLELLFDTEAGTVESDEADVLAVLIDEYEKKH